MGIPQESKVPHNSMTKPNADGDYQVSFTEYVLPNGRTRALLWSTKDRALAAKANAIITNGFAFKIERLRDGVISATITHKEAGDMAHLLAHNDRRLTDEITAMINRFDIAKQTALVKELLDND